MEESRRRRRVRVSPTVADETTPAPLHDAEALGADPSALERGLRGLVGGGSSQVTALAAMRARDAARPRPEDLARAETQLVVVRRNWSAH